MVLKTWALKDVCSTIHVYFVKHQDFSLFVAIGDNNRRLRFIICLGSAIVLVLYQNVNKPLSGQAVCRDRSSDKNELMTMACFLRAITTVLPIFWLSLTRLPLWWYSRSEAN